MIILPKELLEKLETSEYLTMNDRERLIRYIEVMEDYRIFHELYNILQARIDKAIEIYEQCCKTNDFSTCDLEMYEVLNGSDKE